MPIQRPKASPWAGKVLLWPREKMPRQSVSTRRSGRASNRLRGAVDHDRVRGVDIAPEYKLISIGKIRVPKSSETLDSDVVASIAESISISDLLHPIAVRRLAGEIVLVAGAHRLEAMGYLGRKKIQCRFVDGDEAYVQLVRLGEDLFRKTLTVLRRSEKLAEYFNLASATLNVSGQVGQKSKIGRPPSGIALAARELPVVGRSVEARRKIIKRAVNISQITPEAKKAAVHVGIDNHQEALLEVAKVRGHRAQLKKVAELAKRLKSSGTAKGPDSSSNVTVKGPVLRSDTKVSAKDSRLKGAEEEARSSRLTTFGEMESWWKRQDRTLWAYLPFRDRERFIEMLRRTRCLARGDIVEFLDEIFRGRAEIAKRDLFAFAATRGFPKGTVLKALNGLGYQSKRRGRGRGAQNCVINPSREPRRYLPVFSDAEIEAATSDTAASKSRLKAVPVGYFDDVG